MKKRLSPLAMSLCLLGLVASPVFAAVSTSTNSSHADKIALLEQQVSDLQKQMENLKNKKSNDTAPAKRMIIAKKSNQTVLQDPPGQSSSSTSSKKSKKLAGQNQATTSSAYDTTSLAAGNSAIEGPTDLPTTGPLYLPMDLDVPGQSFVSSGPYIGVPFEYTGGHLIVNTPSVNEDILLLNLDKNVDQRMMALGRGTGQALGSHILISGLVEAQALTRNGGGSVNSNDIDLTSVNVDFYVMGPSTWTSAFVELAYDNNIGTQTGSFSSNDRMLDSRVFVNKAFIVLGDFTKSGIYSSFGQMYVPFGVYATTMVSSPLTKILARTLARPLVIGYKSQTQNSFTATGYIFKGPSHVSSVSHVNNGGLNLSFSYRPGGAHYGAVLGAGVIGNIADSVGMQFTGNNTTNAVLFGGFGGPTEIVPNPIPNPADPNDLVEIDSGNEHLVHRVPAYDFNVKVSVGDNLQLIGEYIFASTDFSAQDLEINGEGAKPQALNLEAVYNMPWFVNPTSISAGYQMSKDALAIGLPQKRYSVAINRSFWKNTLQSLEFRHDIDYPDDDTSGGSGRPGPTGNGDGANMITLQFDYYF